MKSNNKNQIIGIVLAILMFLTLANSGYFFLGILKLDIGQWLAFNTCSFAIIVYLICFILFLIWKQNLWLSISLLPMYYYGTMGLFIMPWNEINIFAHITHIIITINVIWIIYKLLKEQEFAILGKGLLIGMIIFVPIIAIIQTYNQVHLEEFMQILQSM